MLFTTVSQMIYNLCQGPCILCNLMSTQSFEKESSRSIIYKIRNDWLSILALIITSMNVLFSLLFKGVKRITTLSIVLSSLVKISMKRDGSFN